MKKKTAPTWNLTLLYKSDTDPRLERDAQALMEACTSFHSQFASANLSNPRVLLSALTAYENITGMLSGFGPALYFSYRKALNTQDTESSARLNTYNMLATKADAKTLFFELALIQLPEETIKTLLSDPSLAHYRYFLKIIFDGRKHRLSEKEEKIIHLKSLPAYGLWIDMQEKMLYQRTIRWKNRRMPLPEAQGILGSLPYKERQHLGKLLNAEYKAAGDIAESEITAVCINKKINDELRSYARPQDQTIRRYQHDSQTVETLVSGVTKHFPIAHRFYELKRRMLKVRALSYHDRNAALPLRVHAHYPFNRSISLVSAAFSTADKRFADILQSFLDNGQIDAYPRKGKEGGAFCSNAHGHPTFVMLNDVGTLSSLSTLAHEMGHAIHGELSRVQSPLYEHYTTPVAETASTFFENLAFDYVSSNVSGIERVLMLHDKIQGSISTIFRQVSCFRLEQDIHERVRKNGGINKKEIARLHNARMSEYLGRAVRLHEDDGHFAVTWSHIRRFFYVYSYAYGELVSASLITRLRTDPLYKERIIEFLSAGSSMSPEDIFLRAGIDTRQSGYILDGMSRLEADIKELEILAQKEKLIA